MSISLFISSRSTQPVLPDLDIASMSHQGIQKHFLLAAFPAQGHINPSLQFAKRVVSTGAQVTFVTTVSAQRRMLNDSTSYPDGLTFAPFSDGYDDGYKKNDGDHYMSEIKRRGNDALSDLADAFAKEGRPVTCVIYTMTASWAVEVARKFQLSSALLWTQPASIFDIFYYYFIGSHDFFIENIDDPSYSLQLPGLPLLKGQDLPSFFHPSSTFASAGLKIFQEQFKLLSQETESFTVLVNTFDELELEALKVVDRFNLIGIGPLIPPPSHSGGEYFKWLDSQKDEPSSVVYVSFGSFAVLTNKQMEELACGLVDSGRPFLWVIRSSEHGSKSQVEEDKDVNEKYNEILRKEHKGMIVPWCSQLDVLNHPSIGCFVTHCGWNSSLESLAMGVPVVAFPQWLDQWTNAKLIEDVWKIGVRVRPNEEDKVVSSEEIIRCLAEVMEGQRGEDLKNNAKIWKDLAREAVKDGGSSDRNLRAFMDKVGKSYI